MATEVYVFVQDGCPACEDFLPRITNVSQGYRARGLPIYKVNIGLRQGTELAKRMRIDSTPTTVIIKGGKKVKSVVGAVDNFDIVALLASLD